MICMTTNGYCIASYEDYTSLTHFLKAAKKKILSDKLIENDGDEYKSFQNLSVDDIRELLKFNNE